ncbi:fungal-specific transcription factor domain-containing protein, partial [Coprinopsis sp. MPI-PUGE-AT-0042]
MNVDSRSPHDSPQLPPPPAPSSTGGTSRKIGLSCAECRRSKLKCDRIFPCQSCVRRGCAGICPEGTLAATKGNKVLMAHAQRLQEQVKTLTAECNDLRAQLTAAGIKHEPRLSSTPQVGLGESSGQGMRMDHDHHDQNHHSDSIGSLSIGVNGQSKYHGESAGSEYLQDLLPAHDGPLNDRVPPDLPPEILELHHSFPFGSREIRHRSSHVFLPYVPDRDRALHLSHLYFVNIGWMYEPISRDDYNINVIDVIYANGQRRLDMLHSHRIAVFFIVLANGSMFDDTDPNRDYATRLYHALARAAFALDSIFIDATTATVQALFLIVRFIYNSDRDRNEERWLITGLNCRIAHMIGLQRDSASWNLPADEVQRRRQIFWELFTWDAWTSVVNGRPAALAVQNTDCQFPDDLEAVAVPGKEPDLGWHAWKLRYAANIMTASSYHVFNPRTPPYESLLDLDKKIRAFPLPAHLRSPMGRNPEGGRAWSPDPSKALQQYTALCTRESNLLYIHRSYFAQALRQQPDSPLHHRYAASVMATYRAATRLITSLRALYELYPRPTSYVWFFWSGIFSSCIVLGALVVESPKCSLATDAIRELQSAIPFFLEGSRPCRSQGSAPILEKLLQRAVASYQTGSEVPRPIGAADVDELHVLGGRKSVIKANKKDGDGFNGPGTPTSAGGGIDHYDSPQSHTGAEEMLAEYLGHPIPQYSGPKYDYDNQSNHNGTTTNSNILYDDPSYAMATDSGPPVHYAPSSSARSPQPTATSVAALSSNPNPAPQGPGGPSPSEGGRHGHHPLPSPSTHSAWPHSPFSQHAVAAVAPQPHHAATAQQMYYGHPLDVGSPQTFNPIVNRYGPGMPHRQTQEEIWRDFMVGYQQS